MADFPLDCLDMGVRIVNIRLFFQSSELIMHTAASQQLQLTHHGARKAEFLQESLHRCKNSKIKLIQFFIFLPCSVLKKNPYVESTHPEEILYEFYAA